MLRFKKLREDYNDAIRHLIITSEILKNIICSNKKLKILYENGKYTDIPQIDIDSNIEEIQNIQDIIDNILENIENQIFDYIVEPEPEFDIWVDLNQNISSIFNFDEEE